MDPEFQSQKIAKTFFGKATALAITEGLKILRYKEVTSSVNMPLMYGLIWHEKLKTYIGKNDPVIVGEIRYNIDDTDYTKYVACIPLDSKRSLKMIKEAKMAFNFSESHL